MMTVWTPAIPRRKTLKQPRIGASLCIPLRSHSLLENNVQSLINMVFN